MTAKQLRFSNDARDALHRGVDSVADAVSVTLGPRGRNVVIDKRFGAPLIINDGVTIARDLEFKDHFENMGAQLLKEIAVKTNDIAGDGTTTATVLGRALINEGLRNLAAGASPTELRRGMVAAAEAVTAAVRAQSHEVAGNEDLQRVASISSGDEQIGTMIAEAFERVGREGVVTVEEGNGIDTEVEVVEGMQFDRGYVSPYLVTDQKAMEAVLEKAAVLVTDAKITAVADLLPALELVVQSGRPLLIVAEDVQAEALATLVVNRLRGSFTAVAVKAPAFGDRRTAMLTDIAVAHRRHGDQREGGPAARRCPARPAGQRRSHRGHQGGHHHPPAAAAIAPRRRARRGHPPRDRGDRVRTGTARSCRSGWRGWSAASPSSRWGRPPRSR